MGQDLFKITIRPRVGDAWPVAIEQRSGGDYFPLGVQGSLSLDLTSLREIALDRRAYGTMLGHALFRDGVLEVFVAALSRARERLHIRLAIEDLSLRHEIAWGRLCAPIDGEWRYLHLNQRLAAAQLIASRSTRVFPSLATRDLATLLVAASPINLASYRLQPFDAQGMIARVQSELRGRHITSLTSGGAEVPSLDAICRKLTERPYPLLHLICHGQFARDKSDTILYLEQDDGSGMTEPVTGTRLIERLSQVGNLPHLIFLESCESAAGDAGTAVTGLAQRLIEVLGVPVVIAMSDRVSMQSADQLAVMIYRHLRKHGTPDRALSEALAEINEQADALVPTLLTRREETTLFTPAGGIDLPIGTDPGSLRTILVAAFSAEEIEWLCAEVTTALRDAGRPLPISLEHIGGTSKDARVFRLVTEIDRYGALPFLITEMQQAKPGLL